MKVNLQVEIFLKSIVYCARKNKVRFVLQETFLSLKIRGFQSRTVFNQERTVFLLATPQSKFLLLHQLRTRVQYQTLDILNQALLLVVHKQYEKNLVRVSKLLRITKNSLHKHLYINELIPHQYFFELLQFEKI